MDKIGTASLCQHLFISRSRVERWISDEVFQPLHKPETGKARRWDKHDAARLVCLRRLIDGGLPVEVGQQIKRLRLYNAGRAFLLLRAMDPRDYSKDGRYQVLIVNQKDLVDTLCPDRALGVMSTTVLDLDEIEQEVDEAFAQAHQGNQSD
ncbi:hypothetical protein A7A08_01854 [Methyloligella halotolerans]|uniref:HTH merR-type domain-containing protein n=1 Tax=Methyloligella halotolerans TaxID=1177755 RepID=A0A1E2RYC8_9HYPH|nr:hypothetical protein [Methyloligella halotolerans]ODA67108.1 hypothetical protein A7A08_01854 [Methyloligella halotolerans]